jgi:hypothetical protein
MLIMKKTALLIICTTLTWNAFSQDLKTKDVPPGVVAALKTKFPTAAKVSWEKEKGNYEANWGGRSGKDLTFDLDGNFVKED